jgi:hypothetical protein
MPNGRTSLAALEAQQGELLLDALPPDGRASTPAVLDGGQRLQVVDALLTVLGGAYAHLPQKRAAYAVDPVQGLQLLRLRCVTLTDPEFHAALSSLVTGLRDAHTRYIGPTVLRDKVAILPFLVEQYGSYADPHFVVSKVAADGSLVGDDEFRSGVRLEWWNGIPFARAVDRHADRETGGRPDSRRARALESLTLRALDFGPPPDEYWVQLGYRTAEGEAREVRIPWRVVEPGRAPTAVRAGSRAGLKVAADPAGEAARRAKKLLFAPDFWLAEKRGATVAGDSWIPTPLQDTLAARPVATSRGTLGYLRIWSFDVDDDDAFVDEVARLLALLPPTGLIVDLRGNPGGLIWAAERLLQLFTPNTVVPTRFSMVATPLTRAMANGPFNRLELGAWAASLELAISTGELYAQPLPLTDPEWCNDRGQCYSGPVVAVVDPNTYSSGDLFAAGFVDNGVGPVVCVGEATGAGGANVWADRALRDAVADTPFAFPPLPGGVGFTVSIRRAVRSGASDGMPIEDLGVAGIPYDMTEHDLLEGNADLLDFCAGLLDDRSPSALSVRRVAKGLVLTTAGLDRVGIVLDGRPTRTVPVTDGSRTVSVPPARTVDVTGWDGEEIRQRRRLVAVPG